MFTGIFVPSDLFIYINIYINILGTFIHKFPERQVVKLTLLNHFHIHMHIALTYITYNVLILKREEDRGVPGEKPSKQERSTVGTPLI